jgi:hypothetical protein
MMGVCAAGMFVFGPRELPRAKWTAPFIGALTSEPWLIVGAAGVAMVQALTFRRRTTI